MRYLVLMAVCLVSLAYGQDVKTYIPAKAHTYAPLLAEEQRRLWPEHPKPELLAGLAETESCISLKHSKCWDPSSKLSTSRELGIGIPQITKAFNTDGSIRFDSLTDIRRAHMAELKELSWQNVEVRPDLQLRILILINRDNHTSLNMITGPLNRLAMTDAAYNGGLKGLQNDRMQCSLTQGCNPQYWFGNVEKTCSKSKKILYGNQSACDINRYHVNRVMNLSSSKYKPFFEPPPVSSTPPRTMALEEFKAKYPIHTAPSVQNTCIPVY